MKTKPVAAVLLLAGTVMLSGCVKIWQENLELKTYMVEASREAEPVSQVLGKKLWIDSVSMLPPYDTRNLILRKNKVEFKTSYYSELLMSPADNFRNEFYRWFSSSGIFEDVSVVERARMSHRLSVSVMDFYGDEEKSEAVLTIKVTLFDENTKGIRVLFSKDYSKKIAVEDSTAEELIQAYNRALIEILTDAEKDIIKALK